MKKTFIFTFIMAILGAIIGAGFASGKEIVAFFGSYGYISIPFLILVGFLFAFCFFIFSNLGKMIRPKSISSMTSAIFGKFGIFVDFIFILCTFITLGSMLAGSDSIGVLVFLQNYNFCYISILTAMITVVVVSVGLKYIYKITNIILPVMITFILIVLAIFFFKGNGNVVSSDNISSNFFSLFLYCFLYVSMNTFSNIFIISKSSEMLNKKQIVFSSIISGGILLVLISTILTAILKGGNEVFLADMPMVKIAFSLGNFYGYAYSIILWLAIFTTICIATFTIVEWLNNFIKNKFLCCVIVVSFGFILSRFGFSNIVSIFYPIKGIFGTFFIVYSSIYYFKNRREYQSRQMAIISDFGLEESKAFDNYTDFLIQKPNLKKYNKVLKNWQKGNKKITIKKQFSKIIFQKFSKLSFYDYVKYVSHLSSKNQKVKETQNSENFDGLKSLTVKKVNGKVVVTKQKNKFKKRNK